MKSNDFVEKIAQECAKNAPSFNICVISPIIAQAICETGFENIENETGLFPYNNFFGMKCGGVWSGASVNLTTWEEYEPGTKTVINDNFRVYDSFEEGVYGYFDFIDWSNYENLKGVTDPYAYIDNLYKDGYATASNYVSVLTAIVNDYNLREYDKLLELPAGLKYKVGDIVNYNLIYGTANSENGYEPYFTQGKITSVLEGARNPYLIDGNIGWVNDECITELAFMNEPVSIDIEGLARAVIRGEYGFGLERRQKLEGIMPGLYDEVQSRVDELLA